MSNQLARTDGSFSLVPKDFDQALQFAKLMASSDMVPKDYRGKPANILVAVQMGLDLRLSPMQALQNICVINGRPCLWGDALLAIVKSHPHCRGVIETYEEVSQRAVCIVRRHGHPDTERFFDVTKAKTAGLWGKPGPWTTHPDRMLQLRARSFACRDAFPDALKGISSAEEVTDIVDARTGEVTSRPTQYVDAVVVQSDKSQTEDAPNGDSKTRAALDGKVKELLAQIDGAVSKQDLSNLRQEILSLPKGSVERAQVIDAGVRKSNELDDESIQAAAEHAARTESEALSQD